MPQDRSGPTKTPIPWDRDPMTKDLFETVVAVLLGNELGHTTKIRPASGDGGVDIYHVLADGRIDVYQAKFFPKAVRWADVEASLALLDNGHWEGREVRDWYLVIPQIQTASSLPNRDTQVTKFNKVTESMTFACHWFGTERLVGLEARHPEIGAFYFGNGRELVERNLQAWKQIWDPIDAGAVPVPDDSMERVSALASILDAHDPHYNHHLATSEPGTAPVYPANAVIHKSLTIGDKVVTHSMVGRYPDVHLHDDGRSKVNLKLRVGDATDRFEDVMRFGSLEPVHFGPEDIGDFTTRLTTGLEGEDVQHHVALTSHADLNEEHLVLRFHADQSQDVEFTRRQLVRGTDGARSQWFSPGGLFVLTIQLEPLADGAANVQIRLHRAIEWLGKPVRELIRDLRLIVLLATPSNVAIHDVTGTPFGGGSLELPELVWTEEVATLVALRAVQRETAKTVKYPTTAPSNNEFTELMDIGAQLEGISTTPTRIASITIETGPNTDPASMLHEDGTLLLSLPLTNAAVCGGVYEFKDPVWVNYLLVPSGVEEVDSTDPDANRSWKIDVDLTAKPLVVARSQHGSTDEDTHLRLSSIGRRSRDEIVLDLASSARSGWAT